MEAGAVFDPAAEKEAAEDRKMKSWFSFFNFDFLSQKQELGLADNFFLV